MNLPEQVLTRFEARGIDVRRNGLLSDNRGMEVVVHTRNSDLTLEYRSQDGEEEDDAKGAHLRGVAATYEVTYPVLGGADSVFGWDETLAVGAADDSLRTADVRFLVNHMGIPYARTSAGTLEVASTTKGIEVLDASLDSDSPDVLSTLSAIRRGDLNEMSIGMRVLTQEWDDEFRFRRITEIELWEVSAVTFPANPVTEVFLRSGDNHSTIGRSEEWNSIKLQALYELSR